MWLDQPEERLPVHLKQQRERRADLAGAGRIRRHAFPGPRRLESVVPLAVALVAWVAFGVLRLQRPDGEIQRELRWLDSQAGPRGA